MIGKSLSFFLFFSLVPGIAFAETPLYDFGSMQSGSSFVAEPGDTLNLSVFFFVDSEYGNRITHILVGVQTVPEGWQVTIDPPEHDTYVNVSGSITTARENLYVEPRDVVPQKPDVLEAGITYIQSPSGKGYLLAKEVRAVVRVPKSAEYGKTYQIKLGGSAFWFGTSGSVAFKQSRPFTYNVKIESRTFSESVVAAPGKAQAAQPAAAQPDYTILIGALAVAVVLAGAFMLLRPKKK